MRYSVGDIISYNENYYQITSANDEFLYYSLECILGPSIGRVIPEWNSPWVDLHCSPINKSAQRSLEILYVD